MRQAVAGGIVGVLLGFLACGCSREDSPAGGHSDRTTPSKQLPSPAVDLFKARQGFHTTLIPNSYKPDPPAEQPPATVFQKIHYTSPAGKLVAYLTPDPGDGKKHPALVWAHGGFGGIGSSNWDARGNTTPFRAAGLIVMCPAWRGENENPGKFELFYGEVEDAVAAVEHVAKLPYVDPARIYMAGHSTGGTITLLTVEATRKLRAAFSFGGCPDVTNLMGVSRGQAYGNTPFDHTNQNETRLRSAVNFVSAIRTPTFFFEGRESALYCLDAQRMEELAKTRGVPFKAFVINGGDHFTIVRPISNLLAKKITADTGPRCNITITQEEVDQAFARRGAPQP